MAEIYSPSIILKEQLTQQDYNEVSALQNLCKVSGPVSLKLELEFKMSQNREKAGGIGEINEFLYYSEDKLIGYIGICDFGGESVEINGMTHPDYRRLGVFKKLFSLVCNEAHKRGEKSVLLLSDTRSEAGLTFIRGLGAVPDHAEREMVLKADMPARTPERAEAVKLRECVVSETDTTYEAEADGMVVGSVRLEMTEGKGGIYGVEILPELRGRGYGKGLMASSIEKLRQQGAGEIRLQVYTDNPSAQHIYESCGFVTVDTMEYYLLK